MLAAPSCVAGASVAPGASVGASVMASVGASVAGASVAGASVAAGGASVVLAPPPHAANREAKTSNVNRLNNNFLVFILFSPLGLGLSATRSPQRYYIT